MGTMIQVGCDEYTVGASVGELPGTYPALIEHAKLPDAGFHPGIFLVHESHLLLVGAGTRLLAYDLRALRRLWEDDADTGFWFWKRHADVILMGAELELAAWDLGGAKIWSTFVEPPWSYEVRGDRVELDVMGKKSTFAIGIGPKERRGTGERP